MMLAKPSSTARMTAREASAEKPIDSLRAQTALRTTPRSSGLLKNFSRSSGTRSPAFAGFSARSVGEPGDLWAFVLVFTLAAGGTFFTGWGSGRMTLIQGRTPDRV